MKYCFRIIVTVFYLFLILFSCAKNENAVIATIGSESLSEEEFQRRFNFNFVFPAEVPLSTQKELVLSSLLAEKALLIYSNPDSFTVETRIARENTLREILIEELRLDSVERTIEITDAELKQEYEKSIWDINVKYLAFNDSTSAWRFYNEVDKSGMSFNREARNFLNQIGHVNDSIPARRILWGKESANLENKVYEMSDGQTSTPFFMRGQYYVFLRHEALPNISATPKDFAVRRDALYEKLLKERAEKKYKDYYLRQIRPLLGKISWQKLQPLYDILIQNAEFDYKSKNTQNVLKPVSKEVFVNRSDLFVSLLPTRAVEFKDGNFLTIEKVLERLVFGPYVFNYSSAPKFKKSFFNMVHLMMEHEAIYNEAVKQNYDESEAVKNKMSEWDSYYTAAAKKYALLQSEDPGNSKQILDDFLMEKAPHLDIKIFPEIYQNINLKPVGILVRKSHFTNRLVAAPVHNFMGLRSWEQYIKTLLKSAQS